MNGNVQKFINAFFLFRRTGGTMVAAASSFYFLLTVIPISLLFIRIAGFFFGDVNLILDKLYILILKLWPSSGPENILQIKNILSGLLTGSVGFTWIHFLVLGWSSLMFLNSIWNGMYQLTDDDIYRSLKRHLKGIVIILITIVLLNAAIGLPMFFALMDRFFSNNTVILYFLEFFPDISQSAGAILNNIFTKVFVNTNILNGLIFTFYFAFLYRWFFSWKISFKVSVIGSLVFVSSFFIGKSLFLIYFLNLKKNYILNYGEFYSFIIGMLWVFLVISFFYYGACICYEFGVEKKKISSTIDSTGVVDD